MVPGPGKKERVGRAWFPSAARVLGGTDRCVYITNKGLNVLLVHRRESLVLTGDPGHVLGKADISSGSFT